ncbi:MAG TPA: pyridoxal 5'-phosphate synthase glutaminase subunit PdxT [Syntrophomonadaceae bacterium]|nr:pyridoxal 5'-phosphate synthase glutaminase subunit PdxT [Syntrophomonadaceae bacterium]
MAGKKIGVLALQGAFLEHEIALARCGGSSTQVRTERELETVDALIIPGGESTTIGKLMITYGLYEPIRKRAAEGMPIWGTCAGMILLAREIVEMNQVSLGLMDIAVRRNAFGRQVDSFETELEIEGLPPSRGVFIRAPYVERVWGNTRVLSRYKDKIIMVREDNLLATAFHPELTDDLTIHHYFLQM